MGYPDTVNLPFNKAIIKDGFLPARPGESVSNGSGFWVIVQGNAIVIRKEGEIFSLCEGALPEWAVAEGEPLSIGRWLGRPLAAVAISTKVLVPPPYVAEPLNATDWGLDERLVTLGGIGLQLLHWERTSALCGRCGDSMKRIAGSWGKRCAKCGDESYPHIHPCIIVLVRRGDEFLLARKPEWAKGRYSLIAGFVEFGESLEECVQREVKEETGIDVDKVRYVGSQSWPFPSQLMAGFVADYAGGEVIVDREELEDARWFCLGNMPQELPGKRSIARWIIDRFALGIS